MSIKERPILFSGPMIRAILEGRKTQTRRVMKHQPEADAKITIGEMSTSKGVAYIGNSRSGGIVTRAPCPYGQPGDRLWVRETWGIFPDNGFTGFKGPVSSAPAEHSLHYKADDGDILAGPWRPSIHMPRWASRITLKITSMRVEQLQDISEDDAIAEGAEDYAGQETPWKGVLAPAIVHGYATLWESINGPGSWNANQWVWVIDFKVLCA